MSHQPYENWIIQGDHLPPDEHNQLKEHLANCPQCRQLTNNLQAVHIRLSNSTQIAPPKGFTQRWQVTLQERLIEQNMKQVLQIRRFFLLLGSAAIASLFLLTLTALIGGDWINKIIVAANRLQELNQWAIQAQNFLFAVLQMTPPVVPVVICLLIGTIFAILVLLWVFSMWRITFQGVKTK